MKDENIGKVFGIYTILDVCNERDKDGHQLYRCQCNLCKGIFIRRLFWIQHATKCKHADIHWKNKRIGTIFRRMVDRCYNQDDKDYKWYGAKGVGICDKWLNNPNLFEEWALSNGYQNNLTIDRINANKDYTAENCRWMPLEDNARRVGKVTWITVQGETLTGRQWVARLQIGINTINNLIRQHGIDKAKELIEAMLKESPATKHRLRNQSWFVIYNIQV